LLKAASNLCLKAKMPKHPFFKVGNFHMYTLLAAVSFVFRRRSRRAFSGQHTICINKLLAFLSNHCAVRFLLWWLFLHRRLRSRQRGSNARRHLSDFCSLSGGSLPKSVSRFYPQNPERIFQLLREPSLSASIQGVNSNFFRLSLLSCRCVAAPTASPCTGQKPVSIFDCRMDSTPFFFLVKRARRRKYLRFCPYLTDILLQTCGKNRALPVEKTVENPASNLMALFKYFFDFRATSAGLCKTSKKGREKFFLE